MRTFRTLTATRCLALSLVISTLSVSATLARPAQGKVPTTASKPIAETSQPAKVSDPVLARNTTNKPEAPNTAPATTAQKTQDKQTIGRCWKRLMTMVREVSHARHTQVKDPAAK